MSDMDDHNMFSHEGSDPMVADADEMEHGQENSEESKPAEVPRDFGNDGEQEEDEEDEDDEDDEEEEEEEIAGRKGKKRAKVCPITTAVTFIQHTAAPPQTFHCEPFC